MDTIQNHKHILFCQNHYNPLGVVRSLGECGINPILIVWAPFSAPHLVNTSKYVKCLHVAMTLDEAYSILINQYGNEEYKPFVYTCSDDMESYLDMHYDQLVDHFYFFDGGSQGQITRAMEKSELCRLAVESGLNIPKTEEVFVGELPRELKYPIITKSVISTLYDWKSNVHICYTEEELLESYRSIRGDKIVLQEYIEKKNELCLDGVSINGGREIYLPIQSEYIRFFPSTYGNYIRFQKFKEKSLYDKIQKLFLKTGFSGIFSIEFLRDKDDNFYFLEINFRNSTWSYPHTCVGVNLPRIWADSRLKGELDISSVDYDGRNFTAIVEFDDFNDSVKPGLISVKQFVKDIKDSDFYFYYNKKDKKPFYITLMRRTAKELLSYVGLKMG